MTLKTTKEQRDALLTYYVDPDVTVYNSVLRDLCHDADEARRMETEMIRLSGLLKTRDVDMAAYRKMDDDLRAKLGGAYEKAAQVCEQVDSNGEGTDCWDWHAKDYAAAIRALKGRG